jgi:hypothetical protein
MNKNLDQTQEQLRENIIRFLFEYDIVLPDTEALDKLVSLYKPPAEEGTDD